jgi:hypothetical protein
VRPVTRTPSAGASNPELVALRTDLLAVFVLAFQVRVRSGATAEEIHRYVNAMKATVAT